MILNKKYSTLKDQINKLFKIIEQEKYNTVHDQSSNNNDDIRSFEFKIKSLVVNHQTNLQNFYDNFISTIESRISSFNQNINKERMMVKNEFEELKNKFEVRFS